MSESMRRRGGIIWLRFSWLVCLLVAGALAVAFGGDTPLQGRAAVIGFAGYVLVYLLLRPLNRWLAARWIDALS